MAAFFGAFLLAQMVVLVLAGVWAVLSGQSIEQLADNTDFTLLATAVNSLIFVGTAVGVARITGSVRARDFGLRRAPFWPSAGKTAATFGIYLAMLGIYATLVNLAKDDAPDKLGAANSATHMVIFALLVGVLAPIAEEVFFRGFIFRAISNAIGIVMAAIFSGLLFGAVHIDSFSNERLLQVVPLAVFGVLLAVLYVWSGTLFSSIALHATNNCMAVASYAADKHSDVGLVMAGVVWLAMMVVCTVGYRITDTSGPDASNKLTTQ